MTAFDEIMFVVGKSVRFAALICGVANVGDDEGGGWFKRGDNSGCRFVFESTCIRSSKNEYSSSFERTYFSLLIRLIFS